MPKVGPWLGWRTQVTTRRPRWAPSAWHRPTVVVDLPSPRGVGVMPATTTWGSGRGGGRVVKGWWAAPSKGLAAAPQREPGAPPPWPPSANRTIFSVRRVLQPVQGRQLDLAAVGAGAGRTRAWEVGRHHPHDGRVGKMAEWGPATRPPAQPHLHAPRPGPLAKPHRHTAGPLPVPWPSRSRAAPSRRPPGPAGPRCRRWAAR